MRVVRMREKAERIEARKRDLGLDDARIVAARNKGTARAPAKRKLLRTIEDEARRQGRTPPFAANT